MLYVNYISIKLGKKIYKNNLKKQNKITTKIFWRKPGLNNMGGRGQSETPVFDGKWENDQGLRMGGLICCSEISYCCSHHGFLLLIFPNSCYSLLHLRGPLNITCGHQRKGSIWYVCTQWTQKRWIVRAIRGRTGKRANIHWGWTLAAELTGGAMIPKNPWRIWDGYWASLFPWEKKNYFLIILIQCFSSLLLSGLYIDVP